MVYVVRICVHVNIYIFWGVVCESCGVSWGQNIFCEMVFHPLQLSYLVLFPILLSAPQNLVQLTFLLDSLVLIHLN